MGALTQYYVRPVNGNDTTGDGLSHATAWKTTQKALSTIVYDTTNGDQVNICSEGTDTLAAPLSFATYGHATSAAPLLLSGYTATANDGGQGVLSGGGLISIINGNIANYTYFKNLKFHDTGAQNVIGYTAGYWTSFFVECEFADSSAAGLTTRDVWARRCYFHDLANGIVALVGYFFCHDSFFDNCSSFAINSGGAPGSIARNVVKCPAGGSGVFFFGNGTIVDGNTIWAAGSTGTGLRWRTGDRIDAITNNIIAGFSGVGGAAIRQVAAGDSLAIYAGNRFYNNTSDFVMVGDVLMDEGDNVALAADPFTSPAGGDFAIGTEAKAGAWPSSFLGGSTNQYIDPGAAQRQEAAAGGGRRPRARYHGV